MKKLSVMVAFAMMFGCATLITSCTNDESEYSNSEVSIADEAVYKIKELAIEYGLDVSFDEDAVRQRPNDVDLAEVERLFNGIASIRGAYGFTKISGGRDIVMKQQGKAATRTRSMGSGYESNSFDTKYKNKNGNDYGCSGTISWEVDTSTGKIGDVTFEPDISRVGGSNGSLSSHVKVTKSLDGRSFKLDGTVTYTEIVGGVPITTTFKVSGTGGKNGTSLKWR